MVSSKSAACRARAFVAIALGLFGCEHASPRCGILDGCDVRSAACQGRALRYAICLRGRDESGDLRIPVETQSRTEFVASWVAEAEAAADETQRVLRRGLSLFALQSADSDGVSEARREAQRVVATYVYDPPHITIVDDGRSLAGSRVATLVHEYVHALQHASGDTDRTTVPAHFDAELAYSALIEGEATILGDEALLQGLDARFDEALYTRTLRTYREMSRSSLLADRDDVIGSLYRRFTYAFGASYLWELRRSSGLSAVSTAFEDPPVSTYAVMALDPERPKQRENDLGDDAVPVLPDMTLRATRHLGRFAYSALAQAFVPYGFVLSFPADKSFVADTLSVFVSSDDVVLSVWRIRFDDAAAVSALVDSLGAQPEDTVHFRREGGDLVMLASEDNALFDLIPDELVFEAAGDDYPRGSTTGLVSRRLACFDHREDSGPDTKY